MAEIGSILNRMAQVNSEILATVRRTDSQRNREVLTLREQFNKELMLLLKEIDASTAAGASGGLSADMSQKLTEVRHKLAHHQAKWRMANIDEQHEEYLNSCKDVNGAIDSFIRWAKDSQPAH